MLFVLFIIVMTGFQGWGGSNGQGLKCCSGRVAVEAQVTGAGKAQAKEFAKVMSRCGFSVQ